MKWTDIIGSPTTLFGFLGGVAGAVLAAWPDPPHWVKVVCGVMVAISFGGLGLKAADAKDVPPPSSTTTQP